VLKARTDYHIVIRSQQEEVGDLHKVALFVNGYDDMQTSIRYYTPFENAQIVVGQFKSIIPAFSGFVHNMILLLYPAMDTEIKAMKQTVQD
jgi:hypothetical protein